MSFPRAIATQEGVRRGAIVDTLAVIQESHLKWAFTFGDTIIHSNEISSIVCDAISLTLLISRTDEDALVLSFRDDDPATFISRLGDFVEKTADDGFCRVYKVRELTLVQSNPIEETVFDAFAKVANVYVSFAKKLIGGDDGEERAGASNRRNPWIVPKTLQLAPPIYTGKHVNVLIWKSSHTREGSVSNEELIRRLIHQGGVDEGIRRHVWLYLLRLRKPEMTDSDFASACWDYELEYNAITNSLKGRRLSEALARIEKDVHRADSVASPSDLIEINAPATFQSSLQAILAAYCAHDPEIEYVQGMCDLLVPLLSVIKDEYLAFWAFVSFMKRMRHCYLPDSASIQRQLDALRSMIHLVDPILHDYLSFEHNTRNLYFCYRWLLVALKREFGLDGVKRVWEVCWASECSNYLLFVALALIYHEKEYLVDNCLRFEDILSHFNRRAESWNVEEILKLASQLHEWFGRAREARQLNELLHSSDL